MAIHESGEDYLEAILILSKEQGYVRSIDVAGYLEVSKPSVSRAMSILRADGYLDMMSTGELRLTESGLEVAERMYERHRLLTEYLVAIGVEQDIAAEDACRIEHIISEQTFTCIREFASRFLREDAEK